MTNDKEQRTENKEQRTKNREQRTENKEQRTKNREQRFESVSIMNNRVKELSQFLQEELTVSSAEVSLIMQKQEELNAPIPMLLWQYGLVSLSGLEQVFDWLEEHY